MSDLGLIDHTLGNDNPIFKRTAHNLGQSWTGLEGTLAGPEYRIMIPIRIPHRQSITVLFPAHSLFEEIQ